MPNTWMPLKTPSPLFLIGILYLAIYTYALFLFTGNDSISSFATDSANYMVMARYLSPWHDASSAIIHVWPQQDYPVFFPFILAIFGAAYDFTLAHNLTALFLVVSLPLIYLYARQLQLPKITAALIVLVVSLSPATWIHSLGILSENLYILLTLLTLILYQRLDAGNRLQGIAFGLLLGLLAITRTIGICMLAAYSIISIINIYKGKNLGLLLPAAIACLLVIIVEALHGVSVPGQYIQQLAGIFGSGDNHAYQGYSLMRQFTSLIDSWFSGWLYYWVDDLMLPYIVFAIIGLLGLSGLIMRAFKLQLDALYLVFYVVILIIWPHPGQAGRFIYPVQFLLLIHACQPLITLFKYRPKGVRFGAGALVLLLALVVVIPTQSYTWHRYQNGKPYGYQFYQEFYLLYNYKDALENAEMQSIMQKDLQRLQQVTGQGAKIMYFTPAYIALLAGRKAYPIKFGEGQDGNLVLQGDMDVDYVYLSKLHPRKTRRNGLDIYPYFKDWTKPVTISYMKNGAAVSYLLAVDPGL